MTPRQAETLEFIREFWGEHQYSPSYEEIKDALGLKSKSGVAFLITKLEEQGFVRRRPNETRSVLPVEFAPQAPLEKKKPWE